MSICMAMSMSQAAAASLASRVGVHHEAAAEVGSNL